MARSHICPVCTTELARVRAVPDPIYALPIVVCPTCSTASVRTKHPLDAHRRERKLAKRAFVRLAFILLLALVPALLTASWTAELTSDYNSIHRDFTRDPRGTITPYALVTTVIIVFSGLLRALVEHRRALSIAAAVTALAVLILTLYTVFAWADNDPIDHLHPSLAVWVLVGALVVYVGALLGTPLLRVRKRSFWVGVNRARRKRRKALA